MYGYEDIQKKFGDYLDSKNNLKDVSTYKSDAFRIWRYLGEQKFKEVLSSKTFEDDAREALLQAGVKKSNVSSFLTALKYYKESTSVVKIY